MSLDVLGEIITTLALSSELYFRAELSEPFSLAVPEQHGVIRFHVATQGSCTIRLIGQDPVALGPGDLVLVPHGAAHVLSDVADQPTRPLSDVLTEGGFDGIGPLVFGGGGTRTVMVCGHFSFADPLLHPILAELPTLVHLRADEGGSYEWVEHVVRRIEREARIRALGHAEITRRLSEILLIEVLRVHADRGELGVLSALSDPQLRRALEAIHAEPEADWSLAQLACLAGHSRTLFVERFRERVGTSPMKYLAMWRLLKARRLLARSEHSVAEVARRVGYASESAFNRAFHAQFGAPPGRFRRTHLAA